MELISAVFTIVGFVLTKGVWLCGAYTIVRKFDLVDSIKARVQDSL